MSPTSQHSGSGHVPWPVFEPNLLTHRQESEQKQKLAVHYWSHAGGKCVQPVPAWGIQREPEYRAGTTCQRRSADLRGDRVPGVAEALAMRLAPRAHSIGFGDAVGGRGLFGQVERRNAASVADWLSAQPAARGRRLLPHRATRPAPLRRPTPPLHLEAARSSGPQGRQHLHHPQTPAPKKRRPHRRTTLSGPSWQTWARTGATQPLRPIPGPAKHASGGLRTCWGSVVRGANRNG
jgi:hypothetical protein